MKKPLPVQIVEAIGWAYVACVALIMVLSMLFKEAPCTGAELIGGFIMLALPVSMVFSLRTGQRFGFIVPNMVVFSLIFLASVATDSDINLALAILSLILLIVPDILLCLSSSRQWLKETANEITKRGGLLCAMGTRILPLVTVALLVLIIISSVFA